MFECTIPGPPVPKARPRLGKHGTYTPPKTKAWGTKAAWLLKAAHKGERLTGPVVVEVRFVLPLPKSRPDDIAKDTWARLHTTPDITVIRGMGPDIDNLAKAILDALNHSGVWVDDRQVVELHACKFYGATPHTSVRVRRWAMA